jgi:hypothetical protein
MASSGKNTKTARTARAKSLAAGAREHFGPTEALRYASGIHTVDDVAAGLAELVALREAVRAAQGALEKALADEEAATPALVQRMNDFESFVQVTFGKSPDVLADFDLAPRKTPRPLTGAEKVAAAAKNAATREARGTKGPRARLAIRGDVVGVSVTPVVAKGTT